MGKMVMCHTTHTIPSADAKTGTQYVAGTEYDMDKLQADQLAMFFGKPVAGTPDPDRPAADTGKETKTAAAEGGSK